ncbi:MAG: four helix bundle protein [Gammaproteobacteria bacterium]|nr:four helix bundle protein [Gammaproteobacteria bacterium]NIR28886.1 four helix bundle protein [Gammaproteobacteria bacterium]NIR97282.1 four helix bundle protein [Gammaproteobacteria bacterium]NIT62982.1 four helix bundle protein [Gammaproteobacteria bacterium]NIV19941.1 four helix bundle protein [Gammaproteobacteria bacterium]
MDAGHDPAGRTKRFALEVIRLYFTLAKGALGRVIGNQMLRSGTSVGAQYREALRARSKAEFISKLSGSLQELEETKYWMELVLESGMSSNERAEPLYEETKELTAILVTALKTAKH